MRKILSERLKKLLVVLGRVKLLWSRQLYALKVPFLFKETDGKMMRQTGGNILQEGEDPILRVLVSENVEDEALFGEKCFSVSGNPIFCCQAVPLRC